MKLPKINLGNALRAIVPILAPIAAAKLSAMVLKGADKLAKPKR